MARSVLSQEYGNKLKFKITRNYDNEAILNDHIGLVPLQYGSGSGTENR